MNFAQLEAVYRQPFFDLLQRARQVHEAHWPEKDEMQLCTLLSIKTGGCSEDCGYCAQSARYSTGVQAERLMGKPEVLAAAERARANGSTRFCMGAAWRGVRAGTDRFNQVLDIVRGVSQLGMEVCVTLGQLSDPEAAQLKGGGRHRVQPQPRHVAGVLPGDRHHAHVPGSARHHPGRPGQWHGAVLRRDRGAGGNGGQTGSKLLAVLTSLDPAPESVPINCLMAHARHAAGRPAAGGHF